jgi:BirA family transcriptional regulator, biotin operon repressor / biotin---[acetyl-CoA-carboxylase] ligase
LNEIASAPIRHYATIDSTNLEAQRLASAGVRDCTWFLADQQTAGIGRENRQWVSEPGNLYTTLLVPIAAPLEKAAQLSLVTAVALYDALAHFISQDLIRIKWPNDLLIEGRKVSGILVQSCGTSSAMFAIGMGVNVAYAPSHMPYPVTCLNDYASTPLHSFFAVLRKCMSGALTQWNNGEGFPHIRLQWLERAKCIGQAVRVTNGQLIQEGTFSDMAPDGALIIASADGSRFVAYAGDVKFLESETS